MIIDIYFPDSCKRDTKKIKEFLQRMVNRLVVGHYRYGEAKKSQRYMSRLIAEVKTYKKTGNQEQLINSANYCFLETIAPENDKSTFDPTVESVTRKKFGK